MILVYVVTCGTGCYQVRSMITTVDQRDYHLKSNLPNPQKALRYAENWAKHSGRAIDKSCFVLQFPYSYVGPSELHTARILIAAMQDDRIYRTPTGATGYRYDPFKAALSDLLRLDFDSEKLQALIEKLNSKGHNVWLENFLLQMSARLDPAAKVRVILRQTSTPLIPLEMQGEPDVSQ